ncbi:MAG: hypothetical protein LZF63_11570, partial [Nitrosomonas sp.]|nr:hypothetical protein [Nitrosomonas sp.]
MAERPVSSAALYASCVVIITTINRASRQRIKSYQVFPDPINGIACKLIYNPQFIKKLSTILVFICKQVGKKRE